MGNLKDVLSEVRASWADAGGGLSPKRALVQHRERQFSLLVTFGVLTVACLGVATWLLVTNGAEAAKTFARLAGLGGAGVGGTVSLGVLAYTWKDWSRTDLLLILIDEASKDQITAMIDKLISKL